MKNNKYKIGIDFHGVISESPVFFRDFTNLAMKKGYEIHIISGGPQTVVQEFLDSWKITYNEIFSLIDHFSGRGEVTYFDNGNFKVDDELWNKSKADYCLANDINIQIDDTSSYGTSFATPFCHYNPKTRVCDTGTCKIDFNVSPEQTISEIENFLGHKH